MEDLLAYVRDWNNFTDKYGQPEQIESEVARQKNPNVVWTLCLGSTEFFTNGFLENEDVISHWETPRPWSDEEGAIFVTEMIWVDCPNCETNRVSNEDWDADECEECEGQEQFVIIIPDCADAKTNEEIWASREL